MSTARGLCAEAALLVSPAQGDRRSDARATLRRFRAEQRHHYILQERVDFRPVIETPYGPTKIEVRIMYLWLDQLQPVNTIIRMGRGAADGRGPQQGTAVGRRLRRLPRRLTMTVLCIASYEKGHAFLRELKKNGWSVVLITSESLNDKAKWPVDSDRRNLLYARRRSHVGSGADRQRSQLSCAREAVRPDRRARRLSTARSPPSCANISAFPALGKPRSRYFRDKLAMRMRAREAGLTVPEFVGIINYDRIREFMDRVAAPWVLKPRSMAGALGIKKLWNSEDLWRTLDTLGDMQSHYLLEQFVPGDIFHVDTIVHRGEIRFAIASGYGRPPMEVSHEGGIFITRTLERGSDLATALLGENARVMQAMGLRSGASHTEFIRSAATGQITFLETSARVGGAHISELVEAATGLNLWAEWAKVEIAGEAGNYEPSADSGMYAGLLISLARQQQPDTSAYNDREVVWRMEREHHVGLIVRSHSDDRVQTLLDAYARRVQADFHTALPPPETATN